MKQYLIGAALLFCAYYMLSNMRTPSLGQSAHPLVSYYPLQVSQPINVCIVQDVSGSVQQNGVELISSDVFLPFNYATDRPVQISFVIASEMSAHPPITVELSAFTAAKPRPFVLDDLPYESRNEAKSLYLAAIKKFQQDSAAFFASRQGRFDGFCARVATCITPYKTKLAGRTDLITALQVADKQLLHWHVSGAANYIIANTDGRDTFHRTIGKLSGQTEVFLVNAQRPVRTSMDSIISGRFASVDQAVTYIITKTNK